jgi:hypothetical protein
MAGPVHMIISLLLCVFLYKVTRGEFKAHHAAIFTINSHFGPDAFGWMPYYGPASTIYFFFHGYGWFFPAFLFAILWYFLTNNYIDFKARKIIPRAKSDPYFLPYEQLYCLVAAGGIFHQYIDLISHPPTIDYAGYTDLPWGSVMFGKDTWFNINSILGTGMFPCGNMLDGVPYQLWFYIIMVPLIFISVIFVLPRVNEKHFPKLAILIAIIYIIPLAISYFIPDPLQVAITHPDAIYYGSLDYFPSTFYLTGGEADLGVFVYMVLFFFVPMIFLYWGFRGVPFKKKPKGEKSSITSAEIKN